mmetsp:Transcript_46244/g.147862  ORF Transcript_46244/g.147862 Transcript_46244/m.147862 type:complete len:266 (-) Transcript_46244:420-1217(-)
MLVRSRKATCLEEEDPESLSESFSSEEWPASEPGPQSSQTGLGVELEAAVVVVLDPELATVRPKLSILAFFRPIMSSPPDLWIALKRCAPNSFVWSLGCGRADPNGNKTPDSRVLSGGGRSTAAVAAVRSCGGDALLAITTLAPCGETLLVTTPPRNCCDCATVGWPGPTALLDCRTFTKSLGDANRGEAWRTKPVDADVSARATMRICSPGTALGSGVFIGGAAECGGIENWLCTKAARGCPTGDVEGPTCLDKHGSVFSLAGT